MTASNRRESRSSESSGFACWECGHEPDEHIGAVGSCIAFVIHLGRETFCLCRGFVPDGGE